MKTPLKKRFLLLVTVAAITLASRAFAQEDVVTPQKRQDALDQAKGMLAVKTPAPVGKNPFHSEAYAESLSGGVRPEGSQTPTTTPTGPRNARDLLQAIATSPSLKPSGFFVLGGEPTLIFGQKRVKAGSLLTITFEGVEYALEIVSIERPNFTLRLNREEFTRTIK